jgi:hypothetical protein
MSRFKQCFCTLLLAGGLMAPAIFSGCAARVRYYDPVYSDYHPWGPPERAYYDRWVVETHRSHVEYPKLRAEEQREYWTWRHKQK